MKARDLIKLLEKHPDAEVVVDGSDHSYRVADVSPGKAEAFKNKRRSFTHLSEYWGPEHMADPPGEVIDVIVVT